MFAADSDAENVCLDFYKLHQVAVKLVKLQSQLVTYWILNMAGYLLYRSLTSPSMIDCTVFLPVSNRGITSKWNSQLRQLHRSSTDFSWFFCRTLLHVFASWCTQVTSFMYKCPATALRAEQSSLVAVRANHCFVIADIRYDCLVIVLELSLDCHWMVLHLLKNGWSIWVLPLSSWHNVFSDVSIFTRSFDQLRPFTMIHQHDWPPMSGWLRDQRCPKSVVPNRNSAVTKLYS